jgi:hypothetical protein
LPVGSVVAFAGDRVPDGWMVCDGRTLSREQWPELFRAIGIAHGAGLSTLGVPEGDFNLPDYRGRFLRGLDLSGEGEASGADPDANKRTALRPGSGNTGNQVGSYQPDATGLPHDPGAPFRARDGSLITGGDAETRPKNVAVRWIIRVHE